MAFWTRLLGTPAPSTDPAVTPGDPHGVELEGEETFSRSLPFPVPSPWSGWPSEWATPDWSSKLGMSRLIDSAWSCLDLNASVLSAMPPYCLRSGEIIDPPSWLSNPDPTIYTSWAEFFKQLAWDYQLGEAFVLPMSTGADGYPLTFRVIPPWLMNVELSGGRRIYNMGSHDVTDEVLHLRYQSATDDARGHGPLEVAGARITTAGVLQRYATRLAETGGVPHYWLGVEKRLTKTDADDLLTQWVESRTQNAGYPALLSGGATLNQMQSMNARDMALLELAQFSESRIAVLLGVPPFLAGLPSGGDSMTYSTVSSLFDFHDRASLRPKANAIMAALSNWALPRGKTVELNRDEYSRPDFGARANAWKLLIEAGVVDGEFVRKAERFTGASAPAALTGVTAPQSNATDTSPPAVPAPDPTPTPTGGTTHG